MNIDIFKHKFIVFCEDHYNPLGICRSLGEKGIKPIVVLLSNHNMIPYCKYVEELHMVSDREEGLQLIIDKWGNEILKPFLYASDDTTMTLLDSHYDILKDKFFFYNAGGNNSITPYLNKEKICKAAELAGCTYPKSEVLLIGEIPTRLKYPILTKAIDSTLHDWKSDMFICKDEQELVKAYKSIKSKKIICQEFIKKKNELCLDGFSINGGDEIWIPYKTHYIRHTPLSYGDYMRLYPFADNEIHRQIQNILQQVNYSGIFEVEFLMDDNDKLYFLEVNFRNSTWSYAYTYGGVNLPFMWAKSTLEGHINKDECVICDKPFTAMVEISDFRVSVVKNKQVSIWKWLQQRFTVDCTYEYNRKDPWPFFMIFIKGLMKRLHLL